MPTTRATVRGVSVDTYKAMRIEAIELDMPVAELLEQMWRTWVSSATRAALRNSEQPLARGRRS